MLVSEELSVFVGKRGPEDGRAGESGSFFRQTKSDKITRSPCDTRANPNRRHSGQTEAGAADMRNWKGATQALWQRVTRRGVVLAERLDTVSGHGTENTFLPWTRGRLQISQPTPIRLFPPRYMPWPSRQHPSVAWTPRLSRKAPPVRETVTTHGHPPQPESPVSVIQE